MPLDSTPPLNFDSGWRENNVSSSAFQFLLTRAQLNADGYHTDNIVNNTRSKGAEDPSTETFKEFPEWVAQHPTLKPDSKVAMFCTGGIRCEKASSYMLSKGFTDIHHLEGGILKYLEEMPEEKSMWNGECYVFDRRVTVNHKLEPGNYDTCRACGKVLHPKDKESKEYVICTISTPEYCNRK